VDRRCTQPLNSLQWCSVSWAVLSLAFLASKAGCLDQSRLTLSTPKMAKDGLAEVLKNIQPWERETA
jgi:hypothetical protein